MNRRAIVIISATAVLLAACSSSSSSGGATSYDEPQQLVDAVRAAGADCKTPTIEPGYYGSDANTTGDVLDIECAGAASRIDMTWFTSADAQKANNALVCELSSAHLHGTPDSMVVMGPNWRVGNAMVDGQYQDLDDALLFTGKADAQALAAALGGEAMKWGTVCDGGFTVQ